MKEKQNKHTYDQSIYLFYKACLLYEITKIWGKKKLN